MRKDGTEHDGSVELEKTLKALLLVQLDGMKQRDQVRLLDRAGFGQKEIANIVGSTSKAISVRLAEIRKDSKAAGRER